MRAQCLKLPALLNILFSLRGVQIRHLCGLFTAQLLIVDATSYLIPSLWRHEVRINHLVRVNHFHRQMLGKDDPHTLESMHELAVLYMQQARYDEAEPLLLEAVKGRRFKLSDKHPHTLEFMNNLIKLYEAWGKPGKAEEWRAKLPQTETKKE